MPYCAILIPQQLNKAEAKNSSLFSDITGKLMSGVTTGGLNFDNATTVLKNAANILIENKDALTTKFAGIALTQLLTQGRISNETAWGYLTQGFPQALNQTAIAMGFQSVEQLKTALKAKNGVNVQQFIKAFENAGTAISNFFSGQETRSNVEGFDVIEVDATLKDSRNYSAETPDRRVQSGQTYQEYIHNLPDMFNLECVLQDGRNYNSDEFEEMLLNVRDRKIAVNVILGDTAKENIVMTNFTPDRGSYKGLKYSLEFKKINVGTVKLAPLKINISSVASVIKNQLLPTETKTTEESSNGFQKPKEESNDSILKGIWAGLKLGFGG